MKMDARNYVRSCDYEAYIRAARLCEREEFDAHNSYMKFLLDADEGNNYTGTKHARLLAYVKKAMTSATNYALQKRQLSKEDKTVLRTYLNRIDLATTGDTLLEICEEGFDLLYKYKPSW